MHFESIAKDQAIAISDAFSTMDIRLVLQQLSRVADRGLSSRAALVTAASPVLSHVKKARERASPVLSHIKRVGVWRLVKQELNQPRSWGILVVAAWLVARWIKQLAQSRDERRGGINAEILRKQDSSTMAAIIHEFADNAVFNSFAAAQTEMIMKQDKEDGDALAKGIQIAVDKGVLSADVTVEEVTKVSVMDRAGDDIADEIVETLGGAPSEGCFMTLQGHSGAGKGPIVTKLQEKLPNCQTWSNDNLFRSITLLAVTKMEQSGGTIEDQIKPDALEEFLSFLDFDKYDGKFDIKIEGLGMKYFVSQVENSVLKEPRIANYLSTVAESTHGEVVNFAQGALNKMAADGMNVILEGREQTLNHIRTPHRFELVLDDTSIIGKHQTAMFMSSKANDALNATPEASSEQVVGALQEALGELDK